MKMNSRCIYGLQLACSSFFSCISPLSSLPLQLLSIKYFLTSMAWRESQIPETLTLDSISDGCHRWVPTVLMRRWRRLCGHTQAVSLIHGRLGRPNAQDKDSCTRGGRNDRPNFAWQLNYEWAIISSCPWWSGSAFCVLFKPISWGSAQRGRAVPS